MTTRRLSTTLSVLSVGALALTLTACPGDDGGGEDEVADETAGTDDDVGDTTDGTDDGTTDDGTTDDGTTDDGTTDDGTTDGTTTGESACSVPDPGWGSPAAVGAPAPHYGGLDQHGEEFSICDYEGVPIAIDTSAVWCGPCQMLSLCLGSDDNACLQLFGYTDPNATQENENFLNLLPYPLRAAIANGSFAWITVLTENAQGGAPSQNDTAAWDSAYPAIPEVIVTADVSQNYYSTLQVQQFPSVWLIDGNMNWTDLNQMTVWNTIISMI